MNETVLLSNIGSTAVITLNRPEKLNAWDTPMRKALAEMLGEVNASGEFRSVVITGSGDRAFSAGQDLDETMHFSSGDEGQNWFLTWRDFYDSVRNLDKPCIAALPNLPFAKSSVICPADWKRPPVPNSDADPPPEGDRGLASLS